MRKIKKSVLVPVLIFVYFIAMTVFFAPELVRTGQIARLVTISSVEIVVLIALHFFLKKREKIGN